MNATDYYDKIYGPNARMHTKLETGSFLKYSPLTKKLYSTTVVQVETA